jgi:glycosyltransferase involved in cell wall biosynthesis
MRVAFIQDMMVGYTGAEKVLEQMLEVLPQADLFCVVDFVPQNQRAFLKNRTSQTSFIQRLPLARSKYRFYLPLMPLAVEQFDVSDYDVVISSSHAVAKGVLTGPDQLHLCMCYSPIRYAWDLQHQYLGETGLNKGLRGAMARVILHYIRLWDTRTANGVDTFIAISRFIARRIHKVYGRDSVVIYPPVDVEAFVPNPTKADFYLTASRLVPYKRIDLIVEAFTQTPQRQLVVIGAGPEYDKIKAKAGANVKLLGYQPFSVLKDHLERARAFVFAAEEDFGIAPLEAQACGTPVIAYGKGGSLETVLNNQTGILFPEQTTASITEALERFEQMGAWDTAAIRKQAEHFSVSRFREEFAALVKSEWEHFKLGI